MRFIVGDGGNQYNQNNVVIENNATGVKIYDKTISSFVPMHTIPAGTLTNGVEYKVKVRIGVSSAQESLNELSSYSDSIIFFTLTEATVLITNITNNLVNNQNYIFQAEYKQSQNERLESYRFFLYDQNRIVLESSPKIFDLDLKYEFTHLANNTVYHVSVQTDSVNGLSTMSGLYPFEVRYVQPAIENALQTTNIPEQGKVLLSTHVVRLNGTIGSGNISYIDGEWINLKEGMIYFDYANGFNLSSEFNIELFIRDITQDVPFLKIITSNGTIELERKKRYNENTKIYAFKKYNNNQDYINLVFSKPIDNYDENTILFIKFSQVRNMMEVRVEVV